VDGLSTALKNAHWPGDPLAPTPIPFSPSPPFNWWILPGNIVDLHVELNAWHVVGSYRGWGTDYWIPRLGPPTNWVNPSANWVNPLPRDSDAWFPFDPLDPEGTGRHLRGGTYDVNQSVVGDGGDYLVMRGTLFQEHDHAMPTPWNQPPTVHHDGWTEMHPPDWIVRVAQPKANARLTRKYISAISPGVSGPDVTVTDQLWSDFQPSSITRRLQIRNVQRLIDPVFTNMASVVTFEDPVSTDRTHLDINLVIRPTGTQQARLKVSWLVSWSEYDVADQVWVDDQTPAGATLFGGGDTWDWQGVNVFSGKLAHTSAIWPGAHQHYFTGATSPMVVESLDTLFAMVFLDPDNPPDEVMLQWHTTDWFRAYWGSNLIGWGADGTPERQFMGPLPMTGEWVRLEVQVPAQAIGINGAANVDGMAFTLFNGRAIWDYAGVCKTSVYQ